LYNLVVLNNNRHFGCKGGLLFLPRFKGSEAVNRPRFKGREVLRREKTGPRFKGREVLRRGKTGPRFKGSEGLKPSKDPF
jgi:hypothetical protein